MKKWLIAGGGVLVLLWAARIHHQRQADAWRELPMAAAKKNRQDVLRLIAEAKPPARTSDARSFAPEEDAPATATPSASNDEAVADAGAPGDDDASLPPPSASGPVDTLKRAYAGNKRDASASTAENRVREIFGSDAVPRSMLIAATCRQTVCRVEVEWSRQHASAYLNVMTRLSQRFSPELAVEPRGARNASGDLRLDLYVMREGQTLASLR